MKILLASGCSWTDTNYVSRYHPDLECNWPKWPELLAKKLGMKAINLGLSGHGFEYIYQSILRNINIKDIGLVVVGWTKASRRDYYDWDKKNNKEIWQNALWDQYGHNRYFIDRMMMYYYSLQQVCESLGIKYKQVQMINSHESATWYDPDVHIEENDLTSYVWPQAKGKVLTMKDHYAHMDKHPLYEKIKEENFIGWPGTRFLGGYNMQSILEHHNTDIAGDNVSNCFISKVDKHPNAYGHELMADHLYGQLNKRKEYYD